MEKDKKFVLIGSCLFSLIVGLGVSTILILLFNINSFFLFIFNDYSENIKDIISISASSLFLIFLIYIAAKPVDKTKLKNRENLDFMKINIIFLSLFNISGLFVSFFYIDNNFIIGLLIGYISILIFKIYTSLKFI